MTKAEVFKAYIALLFREGKNEEEDAAINDQADELWKAMDGQSRNVVISVSRELNRLD